MSKVLQMSLPLKDIRVRGDLLESIDIHEENKSTIRREMIKMRQDFSTMQFSSAGDTLTLIYWEAGKHQPNTPPQLRWRFKVSSMNALVAVNSPIASFLEQDTKNSSAVLQAMQQLSKIDLYFERFLEFEIERIKINAASKVNSKTLEVLGDMQKSVFGVKSDLSEKLIIDTKL